MRRRPPGSTRTDTLFPYTTLFRSMPHVDRAPVALLVRLVDRPERMPADDSDRLIAGIVVPEIRSEEHTSELQSLMRISYAVFCLKKKTQYTITVFYPVNTL